MRFTTLLTTTVLAGTTLAAPIKMCGRQSGSLTSTMIEQIYPGSNSCEGAAFPDECRTAEQAVQPINTSFEKYGLTTPGEQAAALSIMLFESGGFKFNRNHYPEPGRPGQGTRNMQMIDFNKLYASDVAGAEAMEAANAIGPDAVLDLVLEDNESFGSAAWFINTQCSEPIKEGLRAGTKEGWSAYLTQCVGTTDTEERDVIWNKAIEQLKGP